MRASGRIVLREGFKTLKSLLKVNQKKGFDCPGCAWPEHENRSVVEFCENGVKAVGAETTKNKVTRDFFQRFSVRDLEKKDHQWLEDNGRLTEPMVYNSLTDKYEPVTWDKAFELIGDELNKLSSPDEAVFYTSGRTSNEAAFLYQLFGRMFGTNNFPDCSNLCHESSGSALNEVIGIGKGTVTLDDFEKTDAIYIFGQNPGTNHPRMLLELRKASKRGAKILSFNPLKEKGLIEFVNPQNVGEMLVNKPTGISTHYYQPVNGGDQAVLQGMIKYILEEERKRGNILDRNFIHDHTSGFSEYEKFIQNVNWDRLVHESRLTKAQITEAAEVYIHSDRVIICWAMGLTQHKHAVATIQELVNLLLLKGNIGRPGAGVCPVRGHSNVQGNRTVGIYEKPSKSFLDNLGKTFNFKPPQHEGYDVVQAIKAMDEGKAKVFIGMGGNFAAATPDTGLTEQALRNCELTVNITTKLNRSHIVHGKKAVMLPCLGRTESDYQESGLQSVTVEDSMSMVHTSTGRNNPASNSLKSEPAIVAGIAKATLKNKDGVDWDYLVADYDRIRNKIEETIPLFSNFNKRLQQSYGFRLRNSASEREWNTPNAKANFTINEVPNLNLPEGQFRLMTVRSHDQYNTTVYSSNDRYRGILNNRRIVMINPEDRKKLGLKNGDKVNIQSIHADGKERVAMDFTLVDYDIPAGCLGSYFPETNVLVPIDSVADKSNCPTFKFIPVKLTKGTTQ